jgi:hypothetical protein
VALAAPGAAVSVDWLHAASASAAKRDDRRIEFFTAKSIEINGTVQTQGVRDALCVS